MDEVLLDQDGMPRDQAREEFLDDVGVHRGRFADVQEQHFDRRIDRFHRALLVFWFVPFFVFYCFYGPYETWWYTRFLLPVIPALIIGFLLIASRFPRAVVAALIVAIVGFAVWQDRRLGPLNVGADESMYPETIHWAEQQLPRDAIVLNQQFSGSFLYYSGRDTVRFDELDNDRFQLLRAYAGAANLRWYALLTPEEVEQVRRRFAGNWTPIGRHRGMWLMRLD